MQVILGFATCIHAVILPLLSLVAYHLVQVCKYHIVRFSPFFYYHFGDSTHHFTFIGFCHYPSPSMYRRIVLYQDFQQVLHHCHGQAYFSINSILFRLP
jgi:hypothetical protein